MPAQVDFVLHKYAGEQSPIGLDGSRCIVIVLGESQGCARQELVFAEGMI